MRKPGTVGQFEKEWQALQSRFPAERMASPQWLVQDFRGIPQTSAGLYAQLEDARRGLMDLAATGVLEKYAHRYVTSAWTLKDLIAHMSGWAGEMRRQVETAARGGKFNYYVPYAFSSFGPTEWNQREVEKLRDRTLAELLADFDQETRRLQDFVLSAPIEALAKVAQFPMAPSGDPEGLWQSSIAQMVSMKSMHDRHHLLRIGQWLAMRERE